MTTEKRTRAAAEAIHGQRAESGLRGFGAAWAPHSVQYRASAASVAPQREQALGPPPSGAPHSEQKFPDASAPHRSHREVNRYGSRSVRLPSTTLRSIVSPSRKNRTMTSSPG